MNMNIEHRKGLCILRPEGRITLGDGDQALGEAVRAQLAEGERRILLDFSQVSYLDSSGIGELVGCYTAILNRKGELKLCGLSPRVFDLMKLVSLHAVFSVHDSEAEAIESFS